ncbi:MAG: hypothetical protein IJ525_05255 [Alphaproteobacteria bacterium]|nr:hypothetical protein [Alphaproteobacteria bacterium]
MRIKNILHKFSLAVAVFYAVMSASVAYAVCGFGTSYEQFSKEYVQAGGIVLTMPTKDQYTLNILHYCNELETMKKNKKASDEASQPTPLAPQSYSDIIKEMTPWGEYADSYDTCAGVSSAAAARNSTSPNTSGMFSVSVMTGMQRMLRMIYVHLSRLFMLGHAVVCYGNNVDVTHIPLIDINIPNFSFLLSGSAIFFLASMMTMSIGMYFIDISFKIGFAVLFMPISIALWPFKPTHSKFSDNLSIIIRNSMLFTFVAVGVSFSLILITNGIFGQGSWKTFWTDLSNANTESISRDFSIFSTHIIVVAFCMIYGFKILASSVNDYLGYFFSDAIFGSESPMHQMGTQAVGYVSENAIKPAMSYATDVATATAGRAISKTGSTIEKLGSKEGRKELGQDIKYGAHKAWNAGARVGKTIFHPIDSYNEAMHATGRMVNKGLDAAGNLVKEAVDTAYLVTALPKELRSIPETMKTLAKAPHDIIGGVRSMAGDGIGLASKVAAFTVGNTVGRASALAARFNVPGAAAVASVTDPTLLSDLAGQVQPMLHQGRLIADGFMAQLYIQGKELAKHGVSAGIAKVIRSDADTVRQGLHNIKEGGKQTAQKIDAAAQKVVETVSFDVGHREKINQTVGTGVDMVTGGLKAGSDFIFTQSGKYVHEATSTGISMALGAILRKDHTTVRNALHNAKIFIPTMADNAGAGLKFGIKSAMSGISAAAQYVKERANQLDNAIDSMNNSFTLGPSAVVKTRIRRTKQDFIEYANMVKSGLSSSLTPKEMALVPFMAAYQLAQQKVLTATGNTIGFMEQVRATGGKIIITSAGKIVLRTLKDTTKDAYKATKYTAETTAKVTGGILRNFGDHLADNRNHKNRKWKTWAEMNEAAEKKKEAAREEQEYFRSVSDKYAPKDDS